MSETGDTATSSTSSALITPLHAAASGPTLLPGPVASLVSIISKSTSVSIRLGSFVGGAAIAGARIGTLTGLELGRAAIEGILHRAGHDVNSRRLVGGNHVNGWTETGINILRSSISLTQLLLSTGFEISSTTLSTLSSFAETYVLTLDSIFGSTESSRAISAIVSLMRKEFDENSEGEGRIGAADLVIGLTCFAVLQMKTRARHDDEIETELVWDVVADEVGKKVDITLGRKRDFSGETESVTSFFGDEEMDSISVYSGHEDEDEIGSGLPPMFFARLPPSADISITTSSTTTKTTTVEVIGTEPPDFTPPEGAVIISENSYQDDNRPRYKIVYETITNKTENKRVKREDGEYIDTDDVVRDSGRVVEEIPSDSSSSTLIEIPRRKPTRRISSKDKELPTTSKDSKRHRSKGEPIEANSGRRLASLGGGGLEKRRGEKHKLREADFDREERRKEKKREKEKEKEKGKEKTEKRRRRSETLSEALVPTVKRKSGLESLAVSPRSGRLTRSATEPPFSPPFSPPFPPNIRGPSRPTSPEARPFHRSSSRTRVFRRESSISGRSEFHSASAYSQSANIESLDSYLPRSQHVRGSPSVYTIRSSHSQTSLLLESYIPHPDEVFPNAPICINFAKYMRFAAASYGQSFMQFLGLGSAPILPPASAHHAEHHAFSHHTELPLDTILLSSFVDPGGGYDTEGNVNSGIPLVHFVAVDHPSKAIVVTCRGTLGLEDVLTDLTCNYDDLTLRGIKYRVHKGMLNSALLLLRKKSRLLVVVKAALEDYGEYGLVFTGHSLGGGVAAMISMLLSSPCNGTFITSNAAATLTDGVRIPEGRKIHCYSYGTPACVSEELRRATRTLITTVVHGRDIVPSLSFGIIRDFWTVSVAFKEDNKGAKAEIRRRIIDGLSRGNLGGSLDHDDWAFAVMKTLRASMRAEKLVPPGEVWNVVTEKVYREGDDGPIGVTGKLRVKAFVIRDVKKRFQEIGFGSGMMADHSPYCYEKALDALRRGVEED